MGEAISSRRRGNWLDGLDAHEQTHSQIFIETTHHPLWPNTQADQERIDRIGEETSGEEMSLTLSGPCFEPRIHDGMESQFGNDGAHYNIYANVTMENTRAIFPKWQADEYNICVFSTSGIHGTYTTIEDIEASFKKYGENAKFEDGEEPDDWESGYLTVLIFHPRIVCMRYGHMKISMADIPGLRKLRKSSAKEFAKLGTHTP